MTQITRMTANFGTKDVRLKALPYAECRKPVGLACDF